MCKEALLQGLVTSHLVSDMFLGCLLLLVVVAQLLLLVLVCSFGADWALHCLQICKKISLFTFKECSELNAYFYYMTPNKKSMHLILTTLYLRHLILCLLLPRYFVSVLEPEKIAALIWLWLYDCKLKPDLG